MANPKKKLSKNAKAALKILNDSKLLANAKSANELKNEQNFNESEVSTKTAAPHKMRPAKKRG
jgi:hypothetical protein